MAELKSQLRSDLTQAMKTQDKLRTATIRMLLAAIQTEEVSGKQARELSDDEVIKVLARESRKRGEAAEIYTQNGRGELAATEHAEARIIDEYLPTLLTRGTGRCRRHRHSRGGRRTRASAQHETDGSGNEGGHRDRRRESRRRTLVGGGQGTPIGQFRRRLYACPHSRVVRQFTHAPAPSPRLRPAHRSCAAGKSYADGPPPQFAGGLGFHHTDGSDKRIAIVSSRLDHRHGCRP